MQRTKFSNVAGMFYPINSKELSETLETFKNKNKKTYTITTRAIIVPHAGYLYSGQLASEGFEYLDKNIKNIFIIAPSHHEALSQPVIADYDYFQTPLGNIPINKSINEELKTFFNCLFYNQAFEKEHSIEVQLPFLQHYYKDTDIKIIPILISYNLQNFVEKIIEKYYQDTNNAFIISSDLSHFHPDTEAKKIDAITAEMIEDVGTKNLHPLQACGSAGICAINSFSKKICNTSCGSCNFTFLNCIYLLFDFIERYEQINGFIIVRYCKTIDFVLLRGSQSFLIKGYSCILCLPSF